MKKLVKIAGYILFSVTVFGAYADDESSHKHYKAEMPGKSHAEYTAGKVKEKVTKEAPKHKHYKATMPGETHEDYVEGNYPKKDAVEMEKHKHYKATMEGESHSKSEE